MAVLPSNKVPGDILTAAEWNQVLTARDGFLHPIDPASRDEDDNVQDLGSASNRWKRLHANAATFGSTDDVIIGGKSLSLILEENQIDTYATQELFNNNQDGGTGLLSNSFVKAAGDLLVRVLVTAVPSTTASKLTIAFTNGKVESRVYDQPFGSGSARSGPISFFTDIFDISGVANGATVQIDVTSVGTVSSSVIVFKNAF